MAGKNSIVTFFTLKHHAMHLHASPTSADQEQQADEHLLHISTVDSESEESDDSTSLGGAVVLEFNEDELFEEASRFRTSFLTSSQSSHPSSSWHLHVHRTQRSKLELVLNRTNLPKISASRN